MRLPASLLVISLLAWACLATSSTEAAGCGNQGIEFALYKNDQGPNDGGFYSNFSPEHFKKQTPLYQATYTSVGGFNYTRKGPSNIHIYGSARTFKSSLFVLNHRFYFYAPYTSSYTITIFNPDDIALLWLREKAYSGWLRANDEVDCVSDGSPCSTFNVPMQKHKYYAFRIVYAQTKSQAGFSISIVDSNQRLVLDSNTPNSPSLVRFSCDGSAPMFLPFGSET